MLQLELRKELKLQYILFAQLLCSILTPAFVLYCLLILQSLEDVLDKGMRMFYMPATTQGAYIESREPGSAAHQLASVAVQNEQYFRSKEEELELLRGVIHQCMHDVEPTQF
jgi:hypothetical protein